MIQSVSEILKESELIPAREEKIAFFRDKHRNNIPVKTYLQCAFDPSIKFLLPPGMPADYKDSSIGDAQNMIYSRVRELYLFIEGGHPTLKQDKRIMLFRLLLESIDKEDAELLCQVKDKKMPYRGIDYELVAEAYPGLLPLIIGSPTKAPEMLVAPTLEPPKIISEDELDQAILGEQSPVVVEGYKDEKELDTAPKNEVKRGRPKKPKDIPTS